MNNSHQTFKSEAHRIKVLSIRSGKLMFLGCFLAIIIVNSPLYQHYNNFNSLTLAFHIGTFKVSKSLLIWMNEGLMAIFFFLVGLEIRYATESGPLSDWKKVALPVYAAMGGMIVPGLIYFLYNLNHPEYLNGWAIPVATDIAFSLAVLAMVTPGVQPKLRLFLSTLAIIDDIGAILIIAIFYTDHTSLLWMGIALFWLSMLGLLKYKNINYVAPYLLIAVFLWYAIIHSGLHATMTGVILAFLLPKKNQLGKSMTGYLLHGLEPWVNFGILPLFAFMNSGFLLSNFTGDAWTHPILLGSMWGLLIGKPLGVMTFSMLAIYFHLATKDHEITWHQLIGIACLTGVGFTMSLFIATLSFEYNPSLLPNAKVGVLVGSILSGLLGTYFLRKKAK